MKQERIRTRAALLMSAAALLATPVFAQVAAPADAPVAPPPIARTAPQGSPPAGDSATPVNAEAAAQAAAEDAERRAESRPARRARPVARAAAPVAVAPQPEAAPAAQPTPAPAPQVIDPNAVTEVTPPVAGTEQPQGEPTAAAPVDATTTDPVVAPAEPGPPMWPLALIALLIVVGGIWFIMGRRRKAAEQHDVWAEAPLAAEPVVHREPVVAQQTAQPAIVPAAAAAGAAGVMIDRHDRTAAPIDTAPVVAEDATVVSPDSDDVAALTAANTVGDRPWLEFAMRPVRAGTSADEALVEIELTVANAGNSAAEDVRISTFMLPAGNDSDLDRMLVKGDDTAVAPLTIAAGEGTRVDATLAMTRASLPDGGTFQPVVVADARYRLPDGGEGRTSAAFLIGGTLDDGATIEPIDLETRLMREDVGARLYRDPVRV